MKRMTWTAVCLLIMLLFSSAFATTVAGYDPTDSGHDWNDNRYFDRASELYDLTFEFTQYADSTAWSNAKSEFGASATIPEVLFKADLSTSETQKLYADGILIDLAPYIESCMPNLNALLNEHPEWRAAITLSDGAIPTLPKIDELHNQNTMWINTEWLAKLNLSMPTTADELTEVLRAFRDYDPNGNGKKDEIPVSYIGMWDLKFFSHAFGIIADDYNLCMQADGTVVCPITSDEYREFLTWLNQLWNESLIDRNGFTTSDTFRTSTDSDAAITYGVFFAPNPLLLVSSSALSQYSLLPPLKDGNGNMIYRDTLGMVERGTFALTKACPEPEKVLAWIDSLYSDEGIRLAFLGEKDSEYVLHSDGTWSWTASEEEQYNTVHALTTITSGTSTPGYLPASLQANYEYSATARIVDMLTQMAQYTVSPMPSVYLSDEQQSTVNALQAKLGPAIQQALTAFVTGDKPLTDENWNAFCAMTVEEGIQQLIDIYSLVTP